MSISNLFTANPKLGFNAKINTLEVNRITAAQRLALMPLNGTLCYDNDDNCFYFYQNNQWIKLANLPFIPNLSAARLTITSNITAANNATTDIAPLTVNFNVGPALTINATTGTITSNYKGIYEISFRCKAFPATSLVGGPNSQVTFNLLKNNSIVSTWSGLGPTSGQTNFGTFPIVLTTLINLDVNDNIILNVQFADSNTPSNNLNVTSATSELSINLVCPY